MTEQFGFHERETEDLAIGAELEGAEVYLSSRECVDVEFAGNVGAFPLDDLNFAGGIGDLRAAPFFAAQQALNARQQDLEIEWFGQVVVRTGSESHEHILGTATGCEHQQGDVMVRLPKLSGNGEAVFAGEHHVEHEQVEGGALFEQ